MPGPNIIPAHFKRGGIREVWYLALPIYVSMLSQSTMGVVDTFFMGRVGTAQQGAVGFGAILTWTLLSFFTGTINGINTFVAQEVGASRPEKTGGYVWQGFNMAFVGGVVLLALVALTEPIIQLMKPDPEVVPYTVAYLDVRLYGAVFVLLNYCVLAFLRGIGDTRTPMVITLFANLLNIPLNYLLIFGLWGFPELAERGAALATVISTAVATSLYLVVFFNQKHGENYRSRSAEAPNWNKLLRMLRIGAPIGTSWALEMIAWSVFTGLIAGFGKAALAAHNIVIQLLHFSFMPGVAFSIAATTLVGQYIGQKKLLLAEKSGYSSLKLGLAYMGMMALLFLLAREPLTRVFNPDATVVRIGSVLFVLCAIFQLFDALGIISSGIVRGAGDTRTPMLIQLFFSFAVFLPLSYLFAIPLGYGVYGAWTAATIYISLSGLVLFAYFRRGRWKGMAVVDAG